MITFTQLKTLFPLTIEESVASAHIKRATADVEDIDFKENVEAKLEVIGCKAMYYIAPLLWIDMQARVDEYDESMHTFKDIEKFQEYWLSRSSSALLAFQAGSTGISKNGGLLWAGV